MAEQLEQKLNQFNEFFSIEYRANLHIQEASPTEVPATFDDFTQQIPYAFRLASEVTHLDQSSLRALRHLGDVAEDLATYLKAQERKIDLMMSYILSQQENTQSQYQTQKISGSGLTFYSDQSFNLGQILQLKLFLVEEGSAIFSYGEIIAIDTVASGDNEIKVLFSLLQDQDRETLVRTALHQQAKLLKRRNQTEE